MRCPYYANGAQYEMLKEEPNVKPVTDETPHLALEQMDVKHGYRYPVFMISNKYGSRGANFRA